MSLNLQTTFNNKSVALIANGAIEDPELIKTLLQPYERIVAVDGGLRYCQEMGICPDFIIGDFDSVSEKILDAFPDIPFERFLPEKNESDLELAIAAVHTSITEKIGIFGSMGGRVDHSLYNLYLISRFPSKKMIIETIMETIFILRGTQIIHCNAGQQLSLIPFGFPAKGVTTKGLKWELNNAILSKNFMSLSNICMNLSFEITIQEGELICCISR